MIASKNKQINPYIIVNSFRSQCDENWMILSPRAAVAPTPLAF